MIEAESAAPDFCAKLMEKLLCGGAGAFGTGGPFGLRQESDVGTAESQMPGDQQHAVSGNCKGGSGLHRCDVSHFSLSHTEKGFFVSEVDFDIPALKVGLNDLAGLQFRIGADEVPSRPCVDDSREVR